MRGGPESDKMNVMDAVVAPKAANAPSLDAPLKVDLMGRAFKANPYPTFAKMRAAGPVVPVKLPIVGRMWMTTTHAATLAAVKDDELFVLEGENAGRKGRVGMQWWMPKSITLLANNMLTKDDPDHRRLRKLVDKAFARRGILEMRPDVERLADRLLDDLAGRGEVDLLSEYARRLPLYVICDLLGLREENRAAFAAWAVRLAGVGGTAGILLTFSKLGGMIKLLRAEIERVRKSPREGLIGELVKAEADGDKLDEDELLAMVFLLLVAGFETTTNLISGSIVDLEQNPEQKAWLLEAPDERIERAVEELARHVSAVQGTKPRYVSRDTEFHGVKLKRGEVMMAFPAAANADPAEFAEPEKLNLDRFPNHHLAFSSGIHFCLGMQLARLETQVAISRLYERFPALAIRDMSALDYSLRPGIRGMKSLVVGLNNGVRAAA